MKLVKNSIKREYELTYLLAGDLLDVELAKIRKEILELVSKFKGKVIEDVDWGRKRLAYKIRYASKGQEEAIFTHLIIEFPPASVQKINKELSLNSQVMRHLLVLKEVESVTVGDKTDQEESKS